MIFYFSGTGNSRYCAKRLAHRLGMRRWTPFPSCGTTTFPPSPPGPRGSLCLPLTAGSSPAFSRLCSAAAGFGQPGRLLCHDLRGGNRRSHPRLEALCRDMGLTYRGVLPVVMPENYIALFRAPGPEEARAIVAAAVPGLEEGRSASAGASPSRPSGAERSTSSNPDR